VAVIVVLESSRVLMADAVMFMLSKEEVMAVSVGNGGTEVVVLRLSIEEGEPHVPLLI
jgi:hypothetical protein